MIQAESVWIPFAYNAERIRNPDGSFTARLYGGPTFFLDPQDGNWRSLRWYETENDFVAIVPYAENGMPAKWVVEKATGTVHAETWDNLPIINAQQWKVLISTPNGWKQLDENLKGWIPPRLENGYLLLTLVADLSLDGVRKGTIELTYRIANAIKYTVRLESAENATYRVKWDTICQGAYYVVDGVKYDFAITGATKALSSPFLTTFDPYVALSFDDISPWQENYFDMSLLKEAYFVKRPAGSAIELIFGDFMLEVWETIVLDPATNIAPSDDTMVRSGDPNYIYGEWNWVALRDQNIDIFRTWLKFSFSFIPTGSQILSARLKLFLYTLTGPMGKAALVQRCDNDDWSESTMTWNNAPNAQVISTATDNIQILSTGWVSWNVKADIENQLVIDKVVTWRIRFDLENSVVTEDITFLKFYSKNYADAGYRPYLEVTYSIPPNAPTGLQVNGLTSPQRAVPPPKFSAVFTDNVGDRATHMAIEVGISAGDNSLWASWIDIADIDNNTRSENVIYAGSALTRGSTYWWRCRFKNNYGLVGAWSGWENFRLNRTPSADIIAPLDGQSFFVGDNISFKSSSSDNDNDSLTLLWDFNDGSFASTENAVKVYNNPGTYLVRFSAHDGYENWMDNVTISIFIKVEPGGGVIPPVAKKIVEVVEKVIEPPKNVLFKVIFTIGPIAVNILMLLVTIAVLAHWKKQKGIMWSAVMITAFLFVFGSRLV